MKCTAGLLACTIVGILNDVPVCQELLELGKGVLILLQKPTKPIGPLMNIRMIVLLLVLRKTLSLVVVTRIASRVMLNDSDNHDPHTTLPFVS